MEELITYLKERIEDLEREKNEYLERMDQSYTEKGIYREGYFKALEKKIEVEDILLKVYELKKVNTNE